MATKFNKNEEARNVQVRVDLSVPLLNNMIGYIGNVSNQNVTLKSLTTLESVFDQINTICYKTNADIWYRIKFIRGSLKKLISNHGKTISKDLFIAESETVFKGAQYKDIINNLVSYCDMSPSGMEFIRNYIDTTNKYIFMYKFIPLMKESILRFENGDESMGIIVQDIFEKVSDFMATMRNMKLTAANENDTFSMKGDGLKEQLYAMITKIRDTSRILYTGNKRLNEMLSPGYIGSNLYIYAGLPNAGKTEILFKSALDIKKYNRKPALKNEEKTPTVLFVTLEDTMEKLVSRMFSNSVPNEAIKDEEKSVDEIVNMLYDNAQLEISEDNPVNLEIRYFPNRSITTADLYGIIDEIEDNGNEVITVVVDYLKRIKPAEAAKEERDELKNSSNELRNLGIYYDIPVIVGTQMNREGASKVDAARQSKQADATKNLGRSNIGNSWAIQENADVVIIIDEDSIEEKGETKRMKVFYKVKIRYKDDFKVTYFAQKYTNNNATMRDDFGLPEGVYHSVTTLSNETKDKLTMVGSVFQEGGYDDHETEKKEVEEDSDDDKFSYQSL